MAIGSDELPPLTAVPGVRLGTTSAGIKTPGRLDLVVIELAAAASVAAVFTRNAFCAAPVSVARQHLQNSPSPRYLLVNTGNANAGTGEQGIQDALSCCQRLGALNDVDTASVLPFSTGVIGEDLPVDKITAALPAALTALSSEGWLQAAQGIMTTDTRPKGSSEQITIDGHTVTVTGIAKGAGMIKPNMATMLAYVATDARVEPAVLQQMLNRAADLSFNRITVDGDTSTNDACLLIATGAQPVAVSNSSDAAYTLLADAVNRVCLDLAKGLIRDAEGVSKFVEVDVEGGQDQAECLQVAYTIAESPLVKTALYASDPNWGRILAAIGRAGIEQLDVAAVAIHINDVKIAEGGCRASSYDEALATSEMEKDIVRIGVSLARGSARASVYTSDLSNEYVRINAEYRT